MKLSSSAKTATLIAFFLISSSVAIAPPYVQVSAASEWRLTINGLVDHPMTLTIDDLKAMPVISQEATIFCVDFPQVIVTSGAWTGVPLSTLLMQAGVQPSAVKVGFFAEDGYATDLDLTTATSGFVIVAYAKDGAPLGETLRLVVPGRWGYKWISQLATITLFDYDFKGKWESEGYSDEATWESGSSTPGPQYGSSFPNQAQSASAASSSIVPASNSSAAAPSQETQDSDPNVEPQPQAFLTPMLEVSAVAAVVVVVCASLLIFVGRRRRLRASG
jgi:DMSO/TMAO reductase YedYZ molybdopterin-dependent catalytic subunit